MFTEKYISDLSTELTGSNRDNGKIHFVIAQKTKDESTTSLGARFLSHLRRYYHRWDKQSHVYWTVVHRSLQGRFRNKLIDQSNTNAKEASLVPLESENKLKEWESEFINYFSTLIGVNGFFLSRVVREKDNSDADRDFPNFFYKTIACAPLKYH